MPQSRALAAPARRALTTHVLPKLLRGGRTHAATTPIPAGWVPCAGIHPAHPYKAMMGQRIAFDVARHDAFQTLLDRWGDPNLLAAKRGRDLDPDSLVSNRHAQAARRVAEVQARYLRGETVDADTRTPPTMLDPALHGR